MKEYTDQKFFYKAVPVDYDGVARLKRIKGNTLAFNQLVNNGNFTSTNGWASATPSQLSIVGASNNRLLFTCNNTEAAIMNLGVSFPSNHKLLFKLTTDLSNVLKVRIYNKTWATLLPPTDLIKRNGFQYLVINPLSDAGGILYIIPSVYDEVQHYISNVQVFDLTMMGIDTIEQFTSLFPLPYYSYQSTLLPFKGTSIKTVGKNLFTYSVSSLTTNGITFTPQNDGSVKVSGTATGNAYYNIYNWANNTLFPLNQSLRLSGGTEQVRFTLAYRNADGTGVVEAHDTGSGATITIPSADKVIYTALRVLQGTTIDTIIYPMVTFTDAEQTFEPYTSHTTTLPTLTYFPNGMKSAGNVYDELLPTKAITRVGMVDLGSLNYTRTTTQASGVYRFIGSGLPSDAKRPSANNVVANMSSIYQSVTMESVYFGTAPNMSISISAEGTIQLRNDSYTTPEALKSAMNGVYLYYELATPTETDANTNVFYPVYQDGTEEILPSALLNGYVDLGSLDWTASASGVSGKYRMVSNTSPTGIKVSANNDTVANVSTIFTPISPNRAYNGENGIAVATNGRIIVMDDRYSSSTSADAFKQAMQGVMLWYEKSDSTPTTSPIWCDIEYFNQVESEIPYRKFWLVNGNGEKWNLTEKEIKSFLNNPSGLGFRKSIEITRYGERANKINEVYDFPQPQGELLFYDSANSSRYDKYYEFTRFVMNQPITLYYQIPVSYNSMIADTYKLDCEVTELQKTESKPDRIMTTQIVFSGLGFYEGEEIEINGTGTTYTIENKGDFPVGFEITLEGSLMNPYITLSQDGEMYGEAKFDDTTAFSSVYVDSKDGEQNVILKQSGSILPNPLSYQDLSISNGSIYVTFVKLLRGVTELTIGRRSGSLTGVKIKYSPKYRSV